MTAESYANVLLWAVIAVSAVAVVTGVLLAVCSHPGPTSRRRLRCPAIRTSLIMLLIAQALTFVALVLDSNAVTPVWELPVALALALLALCAAGQALYAGRRCLAFCWWGITWLVVRYHDIDNIRVDSIVSDSGRPIPSRVVLVLRGGREQVITGYENLLQLAWVCEEKGVPVDADDVYYVARLRWAVWGLVLFVVLALLVLNALWGAGIIEISANLVDEAPPGM